MSEKKIGRDRKNFEIEKILIEIFFLVTEKILDQNFFWTEFFFGTKFFFDRKFFDRLFFLDRTIFWIEQFFGS